jgi:hypothetical protein
VHLTIKKFIKCPKCETKTWATILVKISRGINPKNKLSVINIQNN